MQFIISAITLFLYMSIWSWIAIQRKRADLADVAWGLGFVLIAWLSFFLAKFSLYGLLVNILVTLWAIRLTTHIFIRNRTRKEDFRYQKWESGWQIYFQVFLLQGAILYFVALPILWVHTYSQNLDHPILWIALILWLFGFIFEAIADYQLLCFQRNPAYRGKLLTSGLWSLVRHPNYLGEMAQWWAIWLFALPIPFGWVFFLSPLLLSFLIIKVSGVAPLEKKMKQNPDFEKYAQNTPSLLPPSFINGFLYAFTWYICVFYGAKDLFFIPLIASIVCYAAQIALFWQADRNSLMICVPLSIYALIIGMVQETGFIYTGVLGYPNHPFWPPFWLLTLYPLFALTLNSSLTFLNRHLIVTFLLGGIGGLLSYLAGEKLGAVHLFSPWAYPNLFLSWGLYLTLLIVLNRKLMSQIERFLKTDEPLTVFFDPKCPICSREMQTLKKRRQTGVLIYACPTSEADLAKMTQAFSYREAMAQIHALDSKGKVLKGIDVLSELYARTDLLWIAIWLQAPVFRPLFRLFYAIWARIRRPPQV